MALILRARAQGLNLPKAVTLLSPWCDLSHVGDSLIANDGRDPTLALDNIKQTIKHYAGQNDAAHPDISPINGQFDADFPPTMITTGTRDLLLSQSVSLARLLSEAGVEVDLRVWEGLWHIFEFDDRLPEAALSLSQISDFLQKVMK